MAKSEPIRISLIAVSLLFFVLPLTFGQEEELPIKLPPAMIIGEERMKIVDTRVPPAPTIIALGVKETPLTDTRGLSEEAIKKIEKVSPVAKSPGCTYSTDVTTSFAKFFKGAEAFYKRAKYHYHIREYGRAWGVFQKLLEKYPESPYVPSAIYWMGEIRWRQGKEKEALTHFQRVFQEFPTSEFADYALYSAGWIHLRLEDPSSAHELFVRMIQGYPHSTAVPLAAFWDGYTLMKMKRWEESIPLFDQILKSRLPESLVGEALYLKGVCLFILQRYKETLAATATFSEEYPSHPLAEGGIYITGWSLVYTHEYQKALQSFDAYLQHFKGGQWEDPVIWGKVKCWVELGDLDQAVTTYQILAMRHPPSLWADNALNEIALYHFQRGDYATTVAVYQDLLREYPESEIKDVSYLRLGESLYRSQEYKEAAHAWENFLKEYPTHSRKKEVYYWLGEVYLMADEYSKGRDCLLMTHDDPSLYPQALLTLGWYEFDKNKWDAALETLQSLLKATPSGPLAQRAKLLLGETLFNQKNYGKSIQVFEEFLTYKGPPYPLRGRALFYQGLAYYKKGEFPSAIARFTHLLNKFPHHPLSPEALFWLGWSYFRQKEFSKAIEAFSRLVKEQSTHLLAPKALMKIGDSYYNLGDNLKAIDSYRKVVKDYPEAPEAPEAEWGIILSFYQDGKYDNFTEGSESFLRRNPLHPLGADVLLMMGDLYRRRADPARAIEAYRRVIADYPTLPLADEARLRRAELLLQMRKTTEAVQVLKEISRKGDNYTQAAFQLGEIYFQQKDYRKAIAYYEELMRLGGAGVIEKVWFRGAEAYQLMDRPAEALRVLRQFVTRYPQADLAGDAWFQIGELYGAEGNYRDALAAYRKALTHEKRDIKGLAQLRIGESYLWLNDKNMALTELMKVYYLFPEQKGLVVKALLKAGEIYIEQEEWDEATQTYQKILALTPQGEEGEKTREMLKKIEKSQQKK